MASVVEEELLRVNQCPHNVFEGELRVVLMFFQMGGGDLNFFRIRFAAIDPAIQFFDFGVGLMFFVIREFGSSAVAVRNLVLDFAAV